MLPPPVLKMTVNFHPLLQNGCLMINGGFELIGLAVLLLLHTFDCEPLQRRPPCFSVVEECSAQKEAVFLSDSSSEVSWVGGVNPFVHTDHSQLGRCCRDVMDVSRVFRHHILED